MGMTVTENKTGVPESTGSSDLVLRSRKHMEINGVSDVMSFDETSAHLNTACGEMMIEGENLHVGTLDLSRGLLTLDGSIDGIYYAKGVPEEKKGFWGKLLK